MNKIYNKNEMIDKIIETFDKLLSSSSTHLSLRIGFARFDDVRTATRIQFKAMRFAAILNFSNLQTNCYIQHHHFQSI